MDSYVGLKARLVWDGTEEVRVPDEMRPRHKETHELLATPPDQMQGTTGERLGELNGRVCYDSLGEGRPSPKYHENILNINHLSIYEHFNKTVVFKGRNVIALALAFINRPWVWVTAISPDEIRVTTNTRAVREWESWTKRIAAISPGYSSLTGYTAGRILADVHSKLTPMLVKAPTPDDLAQAKKFLDVDSWGVSEPINNMERWVSLYMVGSRGFSHELVRHGDFTAISQRSTRYCEESESDWIQHPMKQEFLLDPAVPEEIREKAKKLTAQVLEVCRESYRWWVPQLMAWIKPRLVDDPYAASTARKQARGASRGDLGNALETEIIFSGTVGQWLHEYTMRCAGAADGEIRNIFVVALPCFQASRYADQFAHIKLERAKDGIGYSLAGGGAK